MRLPNPGLQHKNTLCPDAWAPLQRCTHGRRLRRYCANTVAVSVRIATAYAWLTSMAVVVIVPLDVYSTLDHEKPPELGIMWDIAYWCVHRRR